MSNVITFYDIPSTLPGKAWSPNTWKTRYSLNFKGLPYKTVWVEYPDIAELSKKLGIAPTSEGPNGPSYTLPAIYDPTTGTALAESTAIAEYLDKTYPDTPQLLPPGSHSLQHVFISAYMPTLAPLWQFALPATNKILNPRSEEYFRRTREATFGKTLEDLVPSGAAREVEWAKVKSGYDVVDGWLQKNKASGPYFLGKEHTFADFVVASFTIWLKKIWGEDSPEWKDIKTWNEGRWDAFLKELEKYETIL
ncbi:Glutathione S-transferase-like protein ustS [Hypsizygus marmoreus]|uniref:Glutathione S-transferase-like protein ustS n=1 Tax=Hypsizygus marmoreus TaxID=39966 RepID=A0A369JB55_HYPMA|nr:Glutathione S-transferase-like protein ustS [Hypsizygus marmoreus]